MNAIEWILDVQKRNTGRVFLIDSTTGEEITFGQMYASACAVAADLMRRGLKKGSRIALLLHNSPDFVRLYFGCLYAGIITVPINPVLTLEQISFIVRSSRANLLIVSPETMKLLSKGVLKDIGVDVLILADNKIKNTPAGSGEVWNLQALRGGRDFIPFSGVSPSDTLTIVYTSGTTASPKGVVHRISDLIDNARLFTHHLGIGPQNRFYGILALTYLGGYYNMMLLPYTAEASVVLARTFDARLALDFWKPAVKYGVNTLWFVPTIMSIVMQMDRGHEGEKFCRENVICGLVGMAPVPAGLLRDFEARYGITLYENYALSETFFISTNSPYVPRQEGCSGRLLPGVQVTILDNNTKPLPYGQEGEIYVTTPFLMEGYYNPDTGQPDALSPNDWFPTGDIGILTATGDLFITGRKKDLIIRGGINISPASVENTLSQHPAIATCAVVGVPHQIYGEEIAAVVSLKAGYDFNKSQAELARYCKEHLSAVQQPAHFLEIDKFPLSSSGKIQKVKLREFVINKLGLHEAAVSRPAIPVTERETVSKVNGRIRRNFSRPEARIIKKLSQYPTSVISDCLNRMGAMEAGIHSLVRGRPFCGPAVTVEEVEGGNLMSHAALELLQPGDVLVIDAKGTTTRACWGGLQTFMAKERNVAGIVIYGVVRDYEDVVKYGVPVYALGVSPAGPLKGWGGNVNYPISCAGVVVNPGDIVIGDDDGVVVVPQDLAERILPMCERQAAKERQWFEKVGQGEATIDVVGLREKLQNFGVEYE
jgi:long-chain acyl-CoA synthetase